MRDARPLRILQVVDGMRRAGAETWLMHILRAIDRERFHLDFLVQADEPCAYDDEIRALGGRIIPCLHPRRPWAYARTFDRVVRELGPYDVVHSHEHHYSGFILRLARRAGVAGRIAHAHSDTSARDAEAGPTRRLYLALMHRWLARHATVGLAASRQAAGALFGADWEAIPRYRVLYCGIDLAPFEAPPDRAAVRAELGLDADAFVMGHVGRFVDEKNHRFLIELAAEVSRREPRTRLLLAGEGPLQADVERRVAAAGLGRHVHFLGSRADIPRLMGGAMDVLILPSRHEGLPIVGIEAQAAGLPLVLADTITPEVDIVAGLVRRVSLAQPVSAWADEVLRARASRGAISGSAALAAVQGSPFDARTSARELERTYAGAARHR